MLRDEILERGVRLDGRKFDEIRPITIENTVLPRVHGSSVFTRGETQALVTVTLGTADDQQKIEMVDGEMWKRFMLHYNFPPFSVGEVKPMRGPGRREIGHGALAERALAPMMPAEADFAYTVRIVSDILESNGSSSMASVCGGSLAMMDAGVPMKAAVAGVAMGLIMDEATGKYAVLSDIAGAEDHYGDMDFKVAGTAAGITALQMDIKVSGISSDVMRAALTQAKAGRLHILGIMQQALPATRQNMSAYAPRIVSIKIPVDKIRDVIGPGGKMIRSIIEKTGVKIDVEDDGRVNVASADEAAAAKAIGMIQELTATPELNKTYLGKVQRITDFGAFVEIMAGTDGLLHVSEIANHRVKDVRDELKEGQQILVKVINIDPTGKIRLSRKALLPSEGGPPPAEPGSEPSGGEGGGRRPWRPAARAAARSRRSRAAPLGAGDWGLGSRARQEPSRLAWRAGEILGPPYVRTSASPIPSTAPQLQSIHVSTPRRPAVGPGRRHGRRIDGAGAGAQSPAIHRSRARGALRAGSDRGGQGRPRDHPSAQRRGAVQLRHRRLPADEAGWQRRDRQLPVQSRPGRALRLLLQPVEPAAVRRDAGHAGRRRALNPARRGAT